MKYMNMLVVTSDSSLFPDHVHDSILLRCNPHSHERSTPMSWNTKITKLLGIDYPIIQGGMAYISDGVHPPWT